MLPTTAPRKSVVRNAATYRLPRSDSKGRTPCRLAAMLQRGSVARPNAQRLVAVLAALALCAAGCSHHTKTHITSGGPTPSATPDTSLTSTATPGSGGLYG